MPVINGGVDLLNSHLNLSNLISPIGSSDGKLVVDLTDETTSEPEFANGLKTADHGAPNVTAQPQLSELLNELDQNYASTQEKISETFDSLLNSLDNRRTYLLNELKLFYDEKKALVSIQPNEELLHEKFDLETSSQGVLPNKPTGPTGRLDVDLLNNFINNFGKIVRLETATGLFACSIEGKGLSQCTVNEEASFTLSFKNKEDLKLSNVSFLDIYIVTSENTSPQSSTANRAAAGGSAYRPKTYSSRASSSSSSTSSSAAAKSTNLRYAAAKTANCDCTLEVLAEGLYLVKYKLAKRGLYSLNILVNKKHIGQSPYRLVCVERRGSDYALARATNGSARLGIKAVSSLNVRSFHSSVANGGGGSSSGSNNSKARSRPDSSKTSTLLAKNNRLVYAAKSTSSASLLSNFSFSTPRSTSPVMKASNKFAFSSSTGLHQKISGKKASANSTPPSNKGKPRAESSHNTSHDDSVVSSAPSSTILADSLSSPSPISPALSKTNINLSSSSSSSMMMMNLMMRQAAGLNGAAEDDFLFQIGRRGRAQSEFMNPQAVCATADTIYVTDSNNQKIEAFGHNGEFKFTLGVSANPVKLVRRPIGIDSTEGRILCVDYELKCVNVFEESGKFVSKICMNRLLGPKGIAINKAHNNQIVIADSKANSVCIFDTDGKFLQRFGNLGSKNENFAGPQYLSCMSNGDIVVTDFYNHCIKVFDMDGKFKFSFGSNGSEEGQFNGPTGVTTDTKDNIIVVDWGNSRIQVFDKHGNFLRFVDSQYNQLYGPQDVAIINNTIAVADSGNHCVKIFEYS